MRNLVKQTFTAFLAFSIFFTNTAVGLATEIPETPVSEPTEAISKTPLHFQSVMRDIADLKDNKSRPHQSTLLSELDQLITQEQERLNKLNIPKDKQDRYFKQLNAQVEFITNYQPGDSKPSALPEFTPLKNPSSFSTQLKTNSKVKDLSNPKVYNQKEQPKNIESFLKTLRLEKTAEAYIAGYLPVIEDLKNNDFETEITPAIQELAADLGYNPVNIYNFVHNNIDYSPYYGSKKGATACLIEQSCNDVDTSSLTISLMRASGIPARYQQGLALLTTEQLQNLIGTDQIANAYYAFQGPIFTINGEGNLEGQNLLEADFQNVTHVAVSWVHPEIFYPYDERGANFSTDLSLLSLDTTADLQNLYGDFSSEQWLPVEPTLKSYTLQANNILHDQANFNTEQFWQNYLSYQGDLSPIELYAQQLQNQTGQSISAPANQSTKTITAQTFELLPPTLPYQLASGQSDGQQFNINSFTILPNSLKSEVEISLLSATDNQVLFTETFAVSEVNNQPIELVYNGFTDQDKNTLVAHGGIAYTPAALADIAPILKLNDRSYIGQTPLEIGQEMILQFRYTQNNEEILTDQKYSTAGNNEGIFIYFDSLQENPLLDDPDNPDRKSQILLSGNAYIAREYLRNIQADADLLAKSLDATATVAVNRAVVTQKRLLNRVDDLPTTFDFKGLNIDASSHFNYHSNRTSPELHSDDFTNLWLLSASNYEAQVFEDLTGLNAISTVKGLQYAHANPNDYTVHTITAANENIIDGLNLSENTKQNFHDAISAGATIITPDRQVQMDNWLGHLYITRNPNGRNLYAIGEQVPGEWGSTTPEPHVEENNIVVRIAGNDYHFGQKIYSRELRHDEKIVFADGIKLAPDLQEDLTSCILNQELINLADSPEWQSEWGIPCYKNPNSTAKYGYASLLTVNGIRFHIPNVATYWEGFDSIYAQINEYYDAHEIRQTPGLKLEGIDFSIILGTVIDRICTNNDVEDKCKATGAVYYLPTGNGGETFISKGQIFKKLAWPNNEVIEKLGPPVSEEIDIPNTSFASAIKQEFVNGAVYDIEDHIRSFYTASGVGSSSAHATVYSYGPIYDFYQNLGGPNSDLGLPIADTSDEYHLSLGVSYQHFQNNNTLNWYYDDNSEVVVEFTEPDNPVGVEKYDCRIYGGQNEQFLKDLAALRGLADSVAAVSAEAIEGGIDFLAWAVQTDQYLERLQYVNEVGEEINRLINNPNAYDIIDGIVLTMNMTDAMRQEVFDYLEASGECPMKTAYNTGRAIGIVVQAVIAEIASAKLLTTLRSINRISKEYLLSLKIFKAENVDFVMSNLFKPQVVVDDVDTINAFHYEKRAREIEMGIGQGNYYPYENTLNQATVFTLTTDEVISGKFVRAFIKNADGTNNKVREWVMLRSDITHPDGNLFSAAEIKDKFALPVLPTHIADVTFPANVQLRFGITKNQNIYSGVGGGAGWGPGGGEQFEIVLNSANPNRTGGIDKVPKEWFGEETILGN